MNKPSLTPGICRIDQSSKRTHGFFVRIQRNGKLYSAFFSDLSLGGYAEALAAAQQHYQKLLLKFGPSIRGDRRALAERRLGHNTSGIVGVGKIVRHYKGKASKYWQAAWSPEPYVVRRMVFSVRKYGDRVARQLAIQARREGVRQMQ